MMVMFTWDNQGVKVLITSLYHSDIIAINSTSSLVNAKIRICQLPEAHVLEGAKLRIVTVIIRISVLISYKIGRGTSNIMIFLVNVHYVKG